MVRKANEETEVGKVVVAEVKEVKYEWGIRSLDV